MLHTYIQPEYITVRGVKVNMNAALPAKIGLIWNASRLGVFWGVFWAVRVCKQAEWCE